MGEMLSIRLQWVLNAAVKAAGATRIATSRWCRNQRVHIPPEVYDDLVLLHHCTSDYPPTDAHSAPGLPQTATNSIWSRPLSLIVRRQHTAQLFSDASYGSLGGWCPQLRFFWRLLACNLVDSGFDLSEARRLNGNLHHYTEHAAHINVLEFVAIDINFWLTVFLVF
jgi:hypothetical protein